MLFCIDLVLAVLSKWAT